MSVDKDASVLTRNVYQTCQTQRVGKGKKMMMALGNNGASLFDLCYYFIQDCTLMLHRKEPRGKHDDYIVLCPFVNHFDHQDHLSHKQRTMSIILMIFTVSAGVCSSGRAGIQPFHVIPLRGRIDIHRLSTAAI